MEGYAECPYCFESVEVWIDLGGGLDQEYVEDCSICCRPWRVRITEGDDGQPLVHLEREG